MRKLFYVDLIPKIYSPVECIASGVPVICPRVPSIQVIENKLSDRLPVMPYYDIDDLQETSESVIKFGLWYNEVDSKRYDFSKTVGEFFSIENVAKRFLNDLSNLKITVSTKNQAETTRS
ncbi:MAG: hypothetical protein QXV17_12155 [Candidatus Micrarchaeaceae archaeon]